MKTIFKTIIILFASFAMGFNSMSADTVNTHSEGQNSESAEEADSLYERAMETLTEGKSLDFITLITKAAEMDHTRAQVMLLMAYSGLAPSEFPLIEQDYYEAVKWGLKAADKGDLTAQLIIGGFYLRGLGVPIDKAKGLEYIKKSADQGFEKAIAIYKNLTE